MSIWATELQLKRVRIMNVQLDLKVGAYRPFTAGTDGVKKRIAHSKKTAH